MIVEGKNINFRFVDTGDAEFILELRINERKSRFVSQVDNDLSKQIEWIHEYKKREKKGEEYYFIIEDKNKERYGCLRIYDFQGDSFCWGSWILKDGSPSSFAIESVFLVYEFAFYTLNFNNCHFSVRKDNSKVVSFHLRLGAVISSEDELNLYFQYPKKTYEDMKVRYGRYLPHGE